MGCYVLEGGRLVQLDAQGEAGQKKRSVSVTGNSSLFFYTQNKLLRVTNSYINFVL